MGPNTKLRQSADCMHDAYSTLHIGGLAQACSNSIALAIESLQSCTKPSIYSVMKTEGKFTLIYFGKGNKYCNKYDNNYFVMVSTLYQ